MAREYILTSLKLEGDANYKLSCFDSYKSTNIYDPDDLKEYLEDPKIIDKILKKNYNNTSYVLSELCKRYLHHTPAELISIKFNKENSDNLYRNYVYNKYLSQQNKHIESMFYKKYIDGDETDSTNLILKENIQGDININSELSQYKDIFITVSNSNKNINIPNYKGNVHIQFKGKKTSIIKINSIYVPYASIILSDDYCSDISEGGKCFIDKLDCSSLISNFYINDSDYKKGEAFININNLNIYNTNLNTYYEIDIGFCNSIQRREFRLNTLILHGNELINCTDTSFHKVNIKGPTNCLINTCGTIKILKKDRINRFKGKTFVVTGRFGRYVRYSVENIIQEYGGKLLNKITPDINYLLSDESSNSTKYREALSYNIPIIDSNLFKLWKLSAEGN